MTGACWDEIQVHSKFGLEEVATHYIQNCVSSGLLTITIINRLNGVPYLQSFNLMAERDCQACWACGTIVKLPTAGGQPVPLFKVFSDIYC